MALRPRSDSGDAFVRFGGLGVQFAATLVVFGLIGYGIDRWLGTFPFLFLVGILLGAVGAMISIVRQVPPPRGTNRSRSSESGDPDRS